MEQPLLYLADTNAVITLRHWCEQRKLLSSAPTDDLLQLMTAPIGRIDSYIRHITDLEAQLPAQERRSSQEDVSLVPPRLRRLQNELERCWHQLQAVAEVSEELSRVDRNERKLKQLQQRFDSLSIPLVQRGRAFIREDDVCVNGGQQGRLLLFNDLLLFTAPVSSHPGPHEWQVIHRWGSPVELQVTWWPPSVESTEADCCTLTLHMDEEQYSLLFLTTSEGPGEQARARWCMAWRQLQTSGSMREVAASSAMATAHRWLDQCMLNRQQCTMLLYPGLTTLCRETVTSLVHLVLRNPSRARPPIPASSLPALWSALTAVALNGVTPTASSLSARQSDQQHQQVTALTLMALLLDASLHSVAQTREGIATSPSKSTAQVRGEDRTAGERLEATSSLQLLVRLLAPMLSVPGRPQRSVAETLLCVLYLLWDTERPPSPLSSNTGATLSVYSCPPIRPSAEPHCQLWAVPWRCLSGFSSPPYCTSPASSPSTLAVGCSNSSVMCCAVDSSVQQPLCPSYTLCGPRGLRC